jgi:chromate transport protein ChrA
VTFLSFINTIAHIIIIHTVYSNVKQKKKEYAMKKIFATIATALFLAGCATAPLVAVGVVGGAVGVDYATDGKYGWTPAWNWMCNAVGGNCGNDEEVEDLDEDAPVG